MHIRNPKKVHAPIAAYSHQIEIAANARWLVLSGQIGRRGDDSVPADPIEQIEVALENLRLNLDAAGMGVGDLVKLTLYLVGDIDATRRRAVFGAWLGEHRPCTTLLYVSALAAPEYRVEIDAWAAAEFAADFSDG
ncbi:RidA family protein [Pseudomonas sp. CGJS7]|uniref:RidA family protein n=1 Tax=Pseudomonas sp. CGJS7 TaxID=3109348 RepID=UPI0030087D9C